MDGPVYNSRGIKIHRVSFMRALLVVAHGSRRAESNEEVRQLTDQIRGQNPTAFAFIACAFLELAEPSIPAGLQTCADAGASEIVVVPYFLSAGRHVVEDIPAEIAQFTHTAPDVQVKLVPHLGTADLLPGIMLGLANN